MIVALKKSPRQEEIMSQDTGLILDGKKIYSLSG
jgi:hypothetical protein